MLLAKGTLSDQHPRYGKVSASPDRLQISRLPSCRNAASSSRERQQEPRPPESNHGHALTELAAPFAKATILHPSKLANLVS